ASRNGPPRGRPRGPQSHKPVTFGGLCGDWVPIPAPVKIPGVSVLPSPHLSLNNLVKRQNEREKERASLHTHPPKNDRFVILSPGRVVLVVRSGMQRLLLRGVPRDPA